MLQPTIFQPLFYASKPRFFIFEMQLTYQSLRKNDMSLLEPL